MQIEYFGEEKLLTQPNYKVPDIVSIQDMIIQSASRYSGKLAMEDLTDTPIARVTFSELLDKVMKFGMALKKLGLKERSHIAVIGENRVQWGITYLTGMVFNYVVVPIDKNLNKDEILNIIHESDTEGIVFSDSFETMLLDHKHVLKKIKAFVNMDKYKSDSEVFSMVEIINKSASCSLRELPQIDPNETAEIIFTSGSLGRAKGVMLTQRNISSNLMAMTGSLFMYPEDRFLSVLPMHHTYECTCGFLCPLYSGSSVHFARSLRTVAEDLQNVKATMLLAVPLLFEKMFKKIYKSIQEDKVKKVIIKPLIMITDLVQKVGWKSAKQVVFKELHEKFGGHVRIFIAGGAAPDPKIAKGLREFGFTFLQGYGLTETSPILALNHLKKYKDNAAGIPLPGVEIKINNPDNEGIGEIYAKGPNIMPGYYKNQKLTDEAFENGWFKTGDLGFFDEEGFLHISGRKKNVIIANNGKNVFPEEIEDILNRSPFIQESFVYGEENEKHDEIIAAQIFTDAEAFIEYAQKNNIQITQELIHQIITDTVKETNDKLTGYKQIKKFYIREKEFEKTTTQKIKRYLIKKDHIQSQD